MVSKSTAPTKSRSRACGPNSGKRCSDQKATRNKVRRVSRKHAARTLASDVDFITRSKASAPVVLEYFWSDPSPVKIGSVHPEIRPSSSSSSSLPSAQRVVFDEPPRRPVFNEPTFRSPDSESESERPPESRFGPTQFCRKIRFGATRYCSCPHCELSR
jgi:hypothetical protein